MRRKSYIYQMVVALLVTFWAFGSTAHAYGKDPHDHIENGRQIIDLNPGWDFYFSYDIKSDASKIRVDLPHTWNATDALNGKINYRRESGIYHKSLKINDKWTGKRKFLFFEGANSVADVYVNQKYVGNHKGGYTAFCFEITDFLHDNVENSITVEVSNARRNDVLPLVGDFNVYGGLHRSVSLIITDVNCISPLDFASPGVYLTQGAMTAKLAKVNLTTKLSIRGLNKDLWIRSRVINDHKRIVFEKRMAITTANEQEVLQELNITNPIYWNGRVLPYLYDVEVALLQNDRVIDTIHQPLGLRTYHVDPNKGFFLNGKHLDVYGVGRHEDVANRGSALKKEDQRRDMVLLNEIGATAVRSTHYPHSRYFLDLCDQNGILVWSEIPMVGPGGYTGPGFINSPELKEHARTVLKEMIRQNYNHPSIILWGLFNELKLDFDDPLPFINEQHKLAKKEDPGRLTVLATFLDNDYFNNATDLIAWNKYYGWYGGKFEDIGRWSDDTHAKYPDKAIAVSEYGAGGSIGQQEEHPVKPKAGGKWHPEKWQTMFHESNWAELSKRPFIWGKFVWALADFGSSIRAEGETDGINDKGLVSYDRTIKKDAFYFYKANWNPEPMLYLTERRNTIRIDALTDIKVYTNSGSAKLYLNGTLIGKEKADQFKRIIWKNVRLEKGENNIEVKAHHLKTSMRDQMTLTLTDTIKKN